MATIEVDLSKFRGRGTSGWDDIPSFKTKQGQSIRYTFPAPVGYLSSAVKQPDPDQPFPGNRRVEPKRATGFAKYLRDNALGGNWTFPPIQLRAPENGTRDDGAQDGSFLTTMSISRLTKWDIQDGQHRILGVFIFQKEMEAKIRNLRDEIARSERKGEHATIRAKQEELIEAERIRSAILEDSQVEIVLVVANDSEHEQMFSDIARNAKGINPDFATILDARDPVHRIAKDLIETYEPFSGLISSGQSGRMSTKSPELLGAKNVADICHSVIVGPGRVGKNMRQELERDEGLWHDRIKEFLDAMFESFPDLEMLVRKENNAPALRERSLIASASMWRSLAIAWHLTRYEGDRVTADKAKEFFKALEPHLRCFEIVEIRNTRTGELVKKSGMPNNHWLWGPTDKFRVGNRTPEGRHSDINGLGRILADWARKGIPSED